MRTTLIALFVSALVGCADVRGPQAANESAYSGGSIGTSGGGDVSGTVYEYQARLQSIRDFLKKNETILENNEYTLLRPKLQQAGNRLTEPDFCVWDFREQIVNQVAVVSFICPNDKIYYVESRRIWDGVTNTRTAYTILLETMSHIDGLGLSRELINRIADDVTWFEYRGVL